MDVARAWLQQADAAQLPALILAEAQTAGRGRMRRSWGAPPGSALLFSLALRPHWLAADQAQVLVWMAGVALCEGITLATGLQPRLKWPNDVLLPASTATPDLPPPSNAATAPAFVPSRWPKVAGILLEMSSLGAEVDHAIIGCGVNVHANPPSDMPLRYAATNLSVALGHPVARLPLLHALLTRLDAWYTRLQRGEREQLFTAWRTLLLTPGHTIQVETATGIITGYAEDVEPSGALRLRDAAGTVHIIASGDVNA